ncbi:MAG: hypothetical protein ABJZ79_16600, partial [Parasphingorhabdus sp.]|uniref:hypothetical protein n=1 Tax=Parasphingorhabdus sp. TaxID=2709688 RepID=UPI0032975ADB
GFWSAMIDRTRPAADLLSNDDDIAALRKMLAQVLLARATNPKGSKGRPPTGALEEMRDLGLAVLLPEFDNAEALSTTLGYEDDGREVYRVLERWRGPLTRLG